MLLGPKFKRGSGILGIIKSIVEKLKLKELFAIVFIVAMIITFMPADWAQKMKLDSFRSKKYMPSDNSGGFIFLVTEM